jgi:hypothetical protein
MPAGSALSVVLVKLWIDNTTLHGAGRCLMGEGRTSRDLRSLLQLATLIVFADSLELGQFEQGEVVAQSNAVRDSLLRLGLSSPALQIVPTTEDDYLAAAVATAQFAATELPFRFRADEAEVLGLSAFDMPQGTSFRPQRLPWLVNTVVDPEVFDQVATESVPEKAMGAIDYMVSTSADLRSAVRAVMDATEAWSDAQTFQVESMLRAMLNDSLAHQRQAAYAPAPHRGELVYRQNLWLLARLGGVVDDAVESLRGQPLGLPTLTYALVLKSRGSPTGVISEAIAMREKSSALRKSLMRLQQRLREDPEGGQLYAWRDITELGQALRADLRLEGASRLDDAVSFDFPLGLPSASVKASALLHWLRDRLTRSRRTVLTSIVKTAAFADAPQDHLRRLVESACPADAIDRVSDDQVLPRQ